MGILSVAGIAGAAPPANDNFANAINLGSAATVNATGDNTEATLQSGEPDAPYGERTGTVWYSWTAPVSGWVQIDTLGSGFDTVVGVGSGSTIGDYVEIVFNDERLNGYLLPPFEGESLLMFQAQAGTVYRIAVGGWLGNEGPFSLHILPSAGPASMIVSATVAPGSVDVTDGPAEATLTINVQGSVAIGYVDIGLYSSDGRYIAGTGLSDFDLTAGTTQNGTWEGTIEIPRYLAPGDYGINLTLNDFETVASYGHSYDAFLPFPAGGARTITVVNTGAVDSQGPEVTAFSVSPASVDVTSGSGMVLCAFTAIDALAGVRGISVSIVDAFDFPVASGFANPDMDFGGLTSGDANSGTYSIMIEVPQGTAAGTYYFSTSSTDAVSNSNEQSSIPGGGLSDGPLPGNAMLTITNGAPAGSLFDQWASGSGLVPPSDGETAIPFQDGVENLLKYAFNMDGSVPDHHVLVPGSGQSGLPAIYRSPGGITVEYVARSGTATDSRLSYTVETSTSGAGFLPSGIAGLPTPINGSWSRVRVEIPEPPGGIILARLSVAYAP